MSTKAIEEFLRHPSEGGAYTDECLAMLLGHAESGELVFASCCCLAGIPTANHPNDKLQGFVPTGWTHPVAATLEQRRVLSAYHGLGGGPTEEHRNTVRRARLIPLIRAEMEHRTREMNGL